MRTLDISDLARGHLTSRDKIFVAETIKCVGRLACRLPRSSEQALTFLLCALDLPQLTHVVETAIVVLQSMYQQTSSKVIFQNW